MPCSSVRPYIRWSVIEKVTSIERSWSSTISDQYSPLDVALFLRSGFWPDINLVTHKLIQGSSFSSFCSTVSSSVRFYDSHRMNIGSDNTECITI